MSTLCDFNLLTQTRYVLIVLLLLDTCQHIPASARHGLQANKDIMLDCLFLFSCLIVGSCFVLLTTTRGIMCRLHSQSADHVPDSLIASDPSAAWRHAVQVWRPPLVLSMGRRIAIGAADDDPNNDGSCI
jgi:hypothetical protein